MVPQHGDVVQQVKVGGGHIEALQGVEQRLEARHLVVAGVVGGEDGQAAVQVGMGVVEGAGTGVQALVVVAGGMLRVGEVAVGGVQLLFEQGVLGVDGVQ